MGMQGATAYPKFSPMGKLLAYLYLVILATKIASRCRRTLRDEGHSVTGFGMGGSVWLQTAGPNKSPFIRAMGCRFLRCVA